MRDNEIVRSTCDFCNKPNVVGTLSYHYGCPVLFECRDCAPKRFEIVARQDIEDWLATGRVKTAYDELNAELPEEDFPGLPVAV